MRGRYKNVYKPMYRSKSGVKGRVRIKTSRLWHVGDGRWEVGMDDDDCFYYYK